MNKEDLEKTLIDLNLAFKVRGNVFVIKTNEDRTQTLRFIESKIAGSKFIQRSNKNSKGEVKIDAFSIIATKINEDNARQIDQSLFEAAVCFYCAATWYGGDYSDTTLRNTSGYVEAPGFNVEQIIQFLPEHTIKACIKIAHVLKSKYGTKRLSFHKNSGKVSQILDNFNTVNNIYRVFPNSQKWLPANIFLISNNGMRERFFFDNFPSLNTFILEGIKNKDIIPVSLKQTQTATIREMNFTKSKHTNQYLGVSIGKKDYFDSKEVTIYYDGGEIEFKGSPFWQGTIKDKLANNGKIPGNIVNNIIHKFSNAKMDSQGTIELLIKRKNENFYKKFYQYYSSVTRPIDYDSFLKILSKKDVNWQSSKYLGTQLVFILQNQANIRQILLSSFLDQVRSQTDDCSPYVKIE